MNRSRTVSALLFALVLAAGTLGGQTDRGTITGTVTDPTGAPIPGVSVTATHHETNSHYKTDTTTGGEYTLADVPVGEYQVTIEITGFKVAVFDHATIDAGGTVHQRVRENLKSGKS